MIAEFGRFLLILALILSATQAIGGMIAVKHKDYGAVMRHAAWGQCICLVTAFACLIGLFMLSDFSVGLVAKHSNSQLPSLYKFAATWGNHEGSMLMWVTMLGLFSAILSGLRITITPLRARAIALHGVLCLGFIAYTLFLSDPFLRINPPDVNGADLNPLLQHPAMAFHPPFLYFGYTALSIAFVLTISALWQNKMDDSWVGQARIWTLAAWTSLGFGIAMGSWWAYYELGWGGFWFWDPVENSALIPWLSAGALLHCLLALQQRGHLRNWSAALALTSFGLCLCGTFLVRSGVLVSVHTFSLAPERGLFLLGLILFYIGGGISLYVWRTTGANEKPSSPVHPVSRENALLVNNVLINALAASIFLGTVYPLILNAWNGQSITVAAPFFNLTSALFLLPIALGMGIGPSLRWQRDDLTRIAPRVAIFALACFGITAAIYWRYPSAGWMYLITAFSTLWMIAISLHHYGRRVRQTGVLRMTTLPASFHAMTIAHISIAVIIFAAATASFGRMEKTLYQEKGQSVQFAGYRIALDDVRQNRVDNYISKQAKISIYRNGSIVTTLYPEKRFYSAARTTTSEAAVYSNLLGDVYIAIDDAAIGPNPSVSDEKTAELWVLRLWFNPLIMWIWIGSFGLVCAGLISLCACLRKTKHG